MRRRHAPFLAALAASLGAAGLSAGAGAVPTVRTGLHHVVSHSTAFVGSPSSMCPAPLPGARYDGPAVPGGRRTIALTFDDGPGGSTQAIISILERFHVRATFFNVGTGEATWPGLVREESRDGFLLGDHTIDHQDLVTLSPSGQAAEIDGVIHEQRVLVQSSPCVFRPPYGAWNATTMALANQRRMSLWMWNNSGADWMARGSGSAYWVHRIVSLAEGEGINQQHAVVLLHNQRILMPATVAALPQIISFFLQHGYVFEDLLGRSGPPGSCGGPGATAPRVPAAYLASGATLAAGQSRWSPGHQFVLRMRADGDLTLSLATGREVWSSKTAGHPGAVAGIESSGDFVVRSATNDVLWSSGTAGRVGARLAVRADGNLAVDTRTAQVWTSSSSTAQLLPGERLKPNWRLTSPNGLCRLVQERNGALVLRAADGQALWSSGTSGEAGSASVLLRSGTLGVFSKSAKVEWQSWTGGRRDTRLKLTNTGKVVISTRGGARLWETP